MRPHYPLLSLPIGGVRVEMYNLNGYIQALKDEEAGVRAHGGWRSKGNVLFMP